MPTLTGGTFVDRIQTATFIGGTAVGGPQLAGYAHSLGTTPDFVIPVLRSIEVSTANPALMQVLGNASQVTVGPMIPTAAGASAPITAFDILSIYFHSIVR